MTTGWSGPLGTPADGTPGTARAVLYGSACPACRQAETILQRAGLTYEKRPLSDLPASFGRVRSQPQVEIDGLPLGGIDELLRLARGHRLEVIAAGAPYRPQPRPATWLGIIPRRRRGRA